jgi:hypothetical protein
MNAQALIEEQTGIAGPAEDGFIELSDGELRAMVDANAQEYLGMSGEELLHRLRERNPLTDNTGNPVPAWEPVTMLARLLLDE